MWYAEATITDKSNYQDWKWLNNMPLDNLKHIGVKYEITYHPGCYEKGIEFHIVDMDKFIMEKMKRDDYNEIF